MSSEESEQAAEGQGSNSNMTEVTKPSEIFNQDDNLDVESIISRYSVQKVHNGCAPVPPVVNGETSEDDEPRLMINEDVGRGRKKEKKMDEKVEPLRLTRPRRGDRYQKIIDLETGRTNPLNIRKKKDKSGTWTVSRTTIKPPLTPQPELPLTPTPPTQPPAVEEPAKVPKQKVYRCSSCTSFFEKWNLFVHMKEVHNKHICLYCLGMFAQSSKLASHLISKHSVSDTPCRPSEFSSLHPGPQYLLCTVCDKLTDQDTMNSHICVRDEAPANVCSHCGLVNIHYPTCIFATGKTSARATAKAGRRGSETTNETGSGRLSSMRSIEETINRVVEMWGAQEEQPEEKQEDTTTAEKMEDPLKNEQVMLPATSEKDYKEDVEVVEGGASSIPPALSPPEEDSSDSEKLTIAEEKATEKPVDQTQVIEDIKEEEETLRIAGEETPFTLIACSDLETDSRLVNTLKACVKAAADSCVYCAHARKIAANGKQLATHLITEHRFTKEEGERQGESWTSLVEAIKEKLSELEGIYFNATSFDSGEKSCWRSGDRLYECFHCFYATPEHKEFLSHNRKVHQNASFLCIMCKSRFLSYSELLCHLCSGVYVAGQIIDPNLTYRCYICDVDPLPSAFRLMVHLRQSHTSCDMCFELCESQADLAAHVHKHKNIFICYGCGLTYRTRQELSRHIFWKHGAESVTCKRCLQKKWRHAYHFCLPVSAFPCDECHLLLKSTMALRVHRRLHTGVYPHACDQCSDKFISRKLLEKHRQVRHGSPKTDTVVVDGDSESVNVMRTKKEIEDSVRKSVADLLDLPPVNLSESDDSGDEENPPRTKQSPQPTTDVIPASIPSVEEPIVQSETPETISLKNFPFNGMTPERTAKIMLADHDYCRNAAKRGLDLLSASKDHDYCHNSTLPEESKDKDTRDLKRRSSKKRSSSTDSSSSGSTCGSNCSCSSSSSSNSSSTESADEVPTKNNKRLLPKLKKNHKKGRNIKLSKLDHRRSRLNKHSGRHSTTIVSSNQTPAEEPMLQIRDSDLETDEPVTDDDAFYDVNPALEASKIFSRNRSLLVGVLEGGEMGAIEEADHSVEEREVKRKRGPKRKIKGKGKKNQLVTSTPIREERRTFGAVNNTDHSLSETTESGRPKRRRVPLKFYGFSSDDEGDQSPPPVPRKRHHVLQQNVTTPADVTYQTTEVAADMEVEQSQWRGEEGNLWNQPSWRPPPVAPRVHPIKIRTGALKQTFAKRPGSVNAFVIKRAELGGFEVNGTPVLDSVTPNRDETGGLIVAEEKLYCFCQCPYDEVSEMIACDAQDCAIEWFHFECVGIMVPPKGQWFCPDCKKKIAAENEFCQLPFSSPTQQQLV